jgi:hypothetical protein
MIKLVLAGKPHVDKFCEFLHTQKEYKVLNSDQWVSFFEFSRTIGPNLEEYDENGACALILIYFFSLGDVSKRANTHNVIAKHRACVDRFVC